MQSMSESICHQSCIPIPRPISGLIPSNGLTTQCFIPTPECQGPWCRCRPLIGHWPASRPLIGWPWPLHCSPHGQLCVSTSVSDQYCHHAQYPNNSFLKVSLVFDFFLSMWILNKRRWLGAMRQIFKYLVEREKTVTSVCHWPANQRRPGHQLTNERRTLVHA